MRAFLTSLLDEVPTPTQEWVLISFDYHCTTQIGLRVSSQILKG